MGDNVATGDLFLNAREPDCIVAPGDSIELIRLPGIEWCVRSVLRLEALDGYPRYLLEIDDGNTGTVYLWHDDRQEKPWSLTELAPWEEPQSSAILEGEA